MAYLCHRAGVVTGDGKVVAVRGDELSPVNKGLLCVKGYHLPALLYGRDRLKQPLLRNDDGQGFHPVAWDKALDLVAGTFKETLERHGPTAVGMYGSGQWTVFDGYAALKWVKAGMRSNNLEANARLQRMDRMKTEFINMVAHELRTPITNIMGYVETLRDVGMDDREQSKKFLDIVHRNTERLAFIVEDLLSLARLERPEARENLARELTPVRQIIESTNL